MIKQKERKEAITGDFLPCPFCGNLPTVTRLMGYDYWKTQISCCLIRAIDYDDEIQKKWNTRKENK